MELLETRSPMTSIATFHLGQRLVLYLLTVRQSLIRYGHVKWAPILALPPMRTFSLRWFCNQFKASFRTSAGLNTMPICGRCEGLIQLQKAHCDSAWPIAANAAIRAYLHPNEVGLSWARRTWHLRWRKLHESCTAGLLAPCGWTRTRHRWHPPLVWSRTFGADNWWRVLPTVHDLPGIRHFEADPKRFVHHARAILKRYVQWGQQYKTTFKVSHHNHCRDAAQPHHLLQQCGRSSH